MVGFGTWMTCPGIGDLRVVNGNDENESESESGVRSHDEIGNESV